MLRGYRKLYRKMRWTEVFCYCIKQIDSILSCICSVIAGSGKGGGGGEVWISSDGVNFRTLTNDGIFFDFTDHLVSQRIYKSINDYTFFVVAVQQKARVFGLK